MSARWAVLAAALDLAVEKDDAALADAAMRGDLPAIARIANRYPPGWRLWNQVRACLVLESIDAVRALAEAAEEVAGTVPEDDPFRSTPPLVQHAAVVAALLVATVPGPHAPALVDLARLASPQGLSEDAPPSGVGVFFGPDGVCAGLPPVPAGVVRLLADSMEHAASALHLTWLQATPAERLRLSRHPGWQAMRKQIGPGCDAAAWGAAEVLASAASRALWDVWTTIYSTEGELTEGGS